MTISPKVRSHRDSTIQACDRILVLRNGKIAEDGTYDELIAENGFFAELVERQRLDTGDIRPVSEDGEMSEGGEYFEGGEYSEEGEFSEGSETPEDVERPEQ